MCFSTLSIKDSSNTSVNSTAVKSPRQELQSVITQIERENRYVYLLRIMFIYIINIVNMYIYISFVF